MGNNIFAPICTEAPESQFQASATHPVPIPSFYKQEGPVETNNFYGNLLVDKQDLPCWTHPYSVWKCDDDNFKGLGVSHVTAKQRVFGDDPNANPAKYFFAPVGICSISLGAAEFQSAYTFKVGECTRFSCGAQFTSGSGSLLVKLVQGMSFVTGVYSGQLTPRLASKVGVQKIESKSQVNGLYKWVLTLFDQTLWVVYTSFDGLKLENANSIVAPAQKGAIVQVAKLPGTQDSIYDQVAGAYVTDVVLSGDSSGSYTFNYDIQGKSSSGKVLQWYLPHQYSVVDTSSAQLVSGAELDSTCKGIMKGYLTTAFTIKETLPPSELQFAPWKESAGVIALSEAAKAKIKQVATQEVEWDVVGASNTDSMYTAGKILDKGAFILWVVAYVLEDTVLTGKMLGKMKQAFDRFIQNKQQAPLIYNNTWKGIVSSSGLADGNFYCDFGNCFYNDHHFHYGYHIHAAAIVAQVDQKYGDKTFLAKSKGYVETLLRDICNPSSKDKYFPVFRSFDFFGGHSWANGLFAHGDGKDEESTSEDYHCYYGIKLWAGVTGNQNLASVASLILSIERRAMNTYMLYRDDNTVVPSNFKANKVSGILFENKIDHATYFGMNKEYIHGIHMIPLTPVSNYIRNTKFVQEEWDQQKLGELSDSIDGGWKGLLKLNQAIIDPKAAWNFFASDSFQESYLDNGMSRTWSLTYCAGMGGA